MPSHTSESEQSEHEQNEIEQNEPEQIEPQQSMPQCSELGQNNISSLLEKLMKRVECLEKQKSSECRRCMRPKESQTSVKKKISLIVRVSHAVVTSQNTLQVLFIFSLRSGKCARI
jgi:hypothetical protein